jgi:hypothetical protein
MTDAFIYDHVRGGTTTNFALADDPYRTPRARPTAPCMN